MKCFPVCSLKQFISPNICLLRILRLRESHRNVVCPVTSYHITEADKNISRWQFDSLKEIFVETSKKRNFLKGFFRKSEKIYRTLPDDNK